jgi:hypothetical protein
MVEHSLSQVSCILFGRSMDTNPSQYKEDRPRPVLGIVERILYYYGKCGYNCFMLTLFIMVKIIITGPIAVIVVRLLFLWFLWSLWFSWFSWLLWLFY